MSSPTMPNGGAMRCNRSNGHTGVRYSPLHSHDPEEQKRVAGKAINTNLCLLAFAAQEVAAQEVAADKAGALELMDTLESVDPALSARMETEMRDCSNPSLRQVRDAIEKCVPEPTKLIALLKRIKGEQEDKGVRRSLRANVGENPKCNACPWCRARFPHAMQLTAHIEICACNPVVIEAKEAAKQQQERAQLQK